jgi:cephalosporin-C deacetylase
VLTDLDEPALWEYRSVQTRPDDVDAFWDATLRESRAAGGRVIVDPVDTGLRTVEVFDVTFPGFRGQLIRAWLRLPADRTGPLPAVVEYVGYGGGRGHAVDNLFWASAGFAHLQMDTRGQGSAWSPGVTPDPDGTGPSVPGFLTRGIEHPADYYYRRLITDAVRAVDAVRTIDAVDPERIATLGFSQGGGLALAVGALVPDLLATFPFVPFLCDFPRAIRITDHEPYREIGRYLATHRDRGAGALRTLSYIDGVVLAARARVPAWFSAALMDPTCPPSTVFGAFHEWAGPKQITLWPFNGHEGGGVADVTAALSVLQELAAH